MKCNFLFLLALVTSVMFFPSCSNDGEQGEVTNTDTVTVEDDMEDEGSLTTYKIPSPVELFIFMQEAQTRFDKKFLNPVDNNTRYVTTYKRAVNFGVYAADLAYCTVFNQNKETFAYFSVAKKTADDMGLTEGFDESMVKRIDENVGNSDSLYQITNDSYAAATRYMSQQGQENLLPLILAGSWIESTYIAIKSIDKFNPENEVIIRVAEQQFLLESLIEMFSALPEEDKQPDLENKLLDLQQSFDKLYDNVDEIITKAQYEEISSKIKAIRAEMIG